MTDKHQNIDEIVSALREDASSSYPKYPIQALQALRDSAVTERVSKRLSRGARLHNVHALEYDFQAGLNRVCFEFDDTNGLPGRGSVLVLLDGDCEVVGIIDPFRREQPNRRVPSLAAVGGAMPFILERPSAAENLPFGLEDIEDQEERASAFMARKAGGSAWFGGLGGVFDFDSCGPETQTTECTYCSFWMPTIQYYPATILDRKPRVADCQRMDTNNDDCGRIF